MCMNLLANGHSVSPSGLSTEFPEPAVNASKASVTA